MSTYHVKRSSPRAFMHAPMEVKCSAAPGVRLGMVRDLSRDGIFFYSDFKPPIGSRLSLMVVLSGQGHNVSCRATVVRVEQVAVGLVDHRASLHLKYQSHLVRTATP